MKKLKLISLLLAFLFVLSAVVGCSNEKADVDDDDEEKTKTSETSKDESSEASSKEESSETAVSSEAEESSEEESSDEESSEESDIPDVEIKDVIDSNLSLEMSYTSFPKEFTATKVGSINKSENWVYTSNAYGFVYADEKGYSIQNWNGAVCEARYAECEPMGKYFKVSSRSTSQGFESVDLVNCVGLIDVNGNEIVPLQYASVTKINDRFYRVIEVTDITDNEDEALIYFTEDMFSLNPGDGDTLLKGFWYVYDAETGKPIPNVKGTLSYQIDGFEDIIRYVNDNEEYVYVNAKGEVIPEGATVCYNGCYINFDTENSVIAAYDSLGKKLFECDKEDGKINGYRLINGDNEYFEGLSSNNTYVLIDKTGKIVSAEFSSSIVVRGELIECDDKLYNFDGNVVYECNEAIKYISVTEDRYINQLWTVKITFEDENTPEKQLVIDKEGNILYEGTKDDAISFMSGEYLISKKDNDKYLYYSYADKDFTIAGRNYGFATVCTENNEIIDVISGKILISGYESYIKLEYQGRATVIYALNGDIYDVYIVK